MSQTTSRMPDRKPRPWRRRLLLALLFLVLSSVGGIFCFLWLSSHDLNALTAEMDRLDPGWRLDDIEANRKKVPDAENSAPHIVAIGKLLPGQQVMTPAMEKMFENLPPQAKLNGQQTENLDKRLAIFTKSVKEARKLNDMPWGRFPITYSADFFGTTSLLVSNYQIVREVCELLKWDAAMLAQASDADGAMESCLAIHHAARSLGDEPFLISLLVRIACNAGAVAAVERALAQIQFTAATEPSLKSMQAALTNELQEPMLLSALRGERAGSHEFFLALAEGKAKTSLGERAILFLNHQHVAQLRFYNDALEVLKMPSETWEQQLQTLEKTAESKLIFATNLMPALSKIMIADLRMQAKLRCAVAALAAERHRIAHNRWPDSLDVLVKTGFLEAVPTDPFDGKPLRFKRTADGLIVYSVGPDKIDNDGFIDRDNPSVAGTDLGFQLWDVSRRRQPAKPPVREDDSPK